MSRIRVLNLPRNLEESDVRKFFTSKLPQGAPLMEITDICIKKDLSDPTKTRMLFVGFKTAAAGTFAVKHFNQTYFKTAKISVETAAGLADAPLSHKEKMEKRALEQEERRKRAAEKRERDANASAFADPNKAGGGGNGDDAERKRRREEFIKARTETSGGGPSWASELMLPERAVDNDAEGEGTGGKDGRKTMTGYGAATSSSSANNKAAGAADADENDNVNVGDDDDAYKPQHARNIAKAKARRLRELEAEVAKAEKEGGVLRSGDEDEELVSKQEALANVADDDFLSSLMGGGTTSTAAKKKNSAYKDEDVSASDDDIENNGKQEERDGEEDEEGGISSSPTRRASNSAATSRGGEGGVDSTTNSEAYSGGGVTLSSPWAAAEDESEEDIARDSRRIRVSSLPYSATADDVRNFVSSACGPVAEVHVPMTRDTKESKGAAFVLFVYPEDAVAALTKLKGAVFMGRLIRVSAARPDPHATAREAWQQSAAAALAAGDTLDNSGASFKAKKLAQQQAADQKGLSWSTTYMSTSAAVQSMADRLKVDADKIVSLESSGAAVRAAVAEAFLTSEAKAILGDEGISFDVINDSALHKARSNTTILVKNLSPMQTREDSFMAELIKMFRKFGTLENIASPSSRLFAVFGFLHAQDARVAFQRLSYKKFNGAPLFLEWAPLGCLKDDEIGLEDSAMADNNTNTDAKDKHQPQFSLYVTNLPKTKGGVSITDESFMEFISEHCPKVARDPKRYVTGLRLLTDKGQAFISCSDKTTQQYLLAKLNGREFGGRVLKVEVSTSVATGVISPEVVTSEATSTSTSAAGRSGAAAASSSSVPAGCDPHKVIVKNLPFEATEKDLRELFAAFSDVKSVRVPKRLHKFGAHRENNHRGFGFVEFLTEQEAANAIRTLSATHLYGRHLVLQYAKKDDSAE